MTIDKKEIEIYEDYLFDKSRKVESIATPVEVENALLSSIEFALTNFEKMSTASPADLKKIDIKDFVTAIDLFNGYPDTIPARAKQILQRFNKLEESSPDFQWEVAFSRSISLLEKEIHSMRKNINLPANDNKKHLAIHGQAILDRAEGEIHYAEQLIQAYGNSYHPKADALKATIKLYDSLKKSYIADIQAQDSYKIQEKIFNITERGIDAIVDPLEPLISNNANLLNDKEKVEQRKEALEKAIKPFANIRDFLQPYNKRRLEQAERLINELEKLNAKNHKVQHHEKEPYTPSSKRHSQPSISPKNDKKRQSFSHDE